VPGYTEGFSHFVASMTASVVSGSRAVVFVFGDDNSVGVELGTSGWTQGGADLTDIISFIENHNEDPKPFKWTNSADEILASVKRFCHRVDQTLCSEL